MVNKIDKPAARPDWAVDQVFDLLVRLGAPDEILDFPVVYASAKSGYALNSLSDSPEGANMDAISEMIVRHVPPPPGDPKGPLQFQIATIDYSPYLGRLGTGKVSSGRFDLRTPMVVVRRDGSIGPARINKIFAFDGDQKAPVDEACCGAIVSVAGMEDVTVGVTFTDPDKPQPLPVIEIDPPTIAMHFIPNDSPFVGQDGKFVTSRHLEERLKRETLADVALQVSPQIGRAHV